MIIYEGDDYRITKKFDTIEVRKTYDNLSIDFTRQLVYSVIYSELLNIDRKDEIPEYIKEIIIKEKI